MEKLPEVKCLRDLIPVSHGMALEKGWYEGLDCPSDRRIDEIFNNFSSELSEAWEEFRANRLRTWMVVEDGRMIEYDDSHQFVQSQPDGSFLVDHPGCKPEGVAVECADLVIRIADFMGAHTILPSLPDDSAPKPKDIQELIDGLHYVVHLMEIAFREGKIDDASEAATVVVEVCNAFFGKEFFWQIVNLKGLYNSGRSKRHGGKLA